MRQNFNPDLSPHYHALGMAPGASLREIKKRARQMFLQFHPDLNQNNRAFSEEKTKSITAAYSALLAALKSAHSAPPGQTPTPDQPTSEALVFTLSHRLFALSTAQVREILRLKDVRLDDVAVVSDAFPFVAGAFYRNDALVMLWNMHAQLGLKDMPVGSDIGRAKLVHASCDDTPVGFLADDVPGIAPAQNPDAAPHDTGHAPREYICGNIDTDHGPALMLDLRAMIYGQASNF